MRRVVIVRYGEIAVKTGRVRDELEELLVRNIVSGLRDLGLGREQAEVKRGDGRIYIYVKNEEVEAKVVDLVRRVFGVKSVSPAVEIEFASIDDIVRTAEELWAEKVKERVFAVRCHRVGKHDFTSKDVEARVGQALVKYARGVDLENPEIELYVEVRHNRAYFYTDILPGPGGLPLGSESKALALVSGGFDSPVAAWMVMKRGVTVDFMVVSLAGELDLIPALRVIKVLVDRWCIGYTPRVYAVHAEDLVKAIRENVRIELWNIVYKRCLYYMAEQIALRNGYKAIVTGDVIGQVSSQTLDNLYSTEFGLRVPVLRPLVGMDKDDITKLAREIGTYEYSCQVAEYCAVFSSKPKTWSTPEEVDLEFYKIKHVVDRILETGVRILSGRELAELIAASEETAKQLDVAQVPEGAIVLDVRPRHVPKLEIPGVQVIETSVNEVFNIVKQLGSDKKYVVYCTSPLVSRHIAKKLREEGYEAYSLIR